MNADDFKEIEQAFGVIREGIKGKSRTERFVAGSSLLKKRHLIAWWAMKVLFIASPWLLVAVYFLINH